MIRRNPTSPARGRALTLVEVIVAITLMVILTSAMLTFFWQVLEVRDAAREVAGRTQISRQVLSRLAAELRSCVGFDEIGFPVEQRLVGDRRSILFLTSVLPAKHQYDFLRESDEPPPAQHDLTLVGYRLWVDPDDTDDDGEPIVGGILRSEKKTLNQFLIDEDDPLNVRNDLWSPELGYLEFRYFDGVEWTTTWDITQGNSLPQAVQVTVGFDTITDAELEDQDLDEYPIEEYPYGDDLLHPDRYSVVVRIPAADQLFGSRVQRLGQQLADQLGVEGLP